jgi:hypothetical protein
MSFYLNLLFSAFFMLLGLYVATLAPAAGAIVFASMFLVAGLVFLFIASIVKNGGSL